MTNNSSKSFVSSVPQKTRSKGMMFPKLVIEKKVNVSWTWRTFCCKRFYAWIDCATVTNVSISLLDPMNPNRITAHTETHRNFTAWKFESSVNHSMCSNKSIHKFDWLRIEPPNRVSFIHISATQLRVNIHLDTIYNRLPKNLLTFFQFTLQLIFYMLRLMDNYSSQKYIANPHVCKHFTCVRIAEMFPEEAHNKSLVSALCYHHFHAFTHKGIKERSYKS